MRSTITIRSDGSRRMAVVVWAAAAVAVVFIGVDGALAGLAGYGLIPAIAAVLAWMVLWRPTTVLAPEGVKVVNPVRTVLVPWSSIRSVDSRWSLRIETDRGRVGSWSVPSRRALQARPMKARQHATRAGLLELADLGRDLTVTADADQVGEVLAQCRTGPDPDRATSWQLNTGPLGALAAVTASALLMQAVAG